MAPTGRIVGSGDKNDMKRKIEYVYISNNYYYVHVCVTQNGDSFDFVTLTILLKNRCFAT